MLKWFKKRAEKGATLAVCPGVSGIAAAAVSARPGEAPVLDWVDYLPVTFDAADREAVLTAALREHDVDGAAATSVMAVGEYNLLLVESPGVPEAELRAAVRWRVKDLIDFDIGDAVVDVVEVPPLKGGRDNMLYAVVARKTAVRAIVDELEAAELELQTVDIPEFAIRNLTALIAEDAGGVAFIYLEEDSGLITITRQGTLYLSRRFDGGRRRLTGSGATEVTPELEGFLDSIVIEIQRSLDYYESQFAQPPIQNIVIAPLGREIAGVDGYLGSQLGVNARVLQLPELIDAKTPIEPEDEARCLLSVGAALRNVEIAAA